MRYEWFVGLRYLKAKRKQTFISVITIISVIGVTVGVMALIVVLSVMSGFEKTLKEKIVGIQAHLIVQKAVEEGIQDYDRLAREVERVKGVSAAAPFIFGQVMLSSQSHVTGAILKGIDPKQEVRVTELGSYLKTGSIDDLDRSEGDIPHIFVGVEMAKNLAIDRGDIVQVVSPFGGLTPMGMVPKVKRFRVAGIFRSGHFEYDSTLVYVSLESAQKFFNMGSKVTGIEVRTNDIYRAKEIGKQIRQSLGFPYWTKDWMEMNRNLFAALKLEKVAMFIILVLIVLVAAFNIISTLIMVVMEKNRDIAILKAMGAPSKGILRIFMIEGLVIGVLGTALGTVFGLLIAFNLEQVTAFVEHLFGFRILSSEVYYIDKLPSQVNPVEVIVTVSTAIILSLLAALYPSWRASRLDPAEALRYE